MCFLAVAFEQHLTLGKVSWTAEAKMDARGVFGEGRCDHILLVIPLTN